MDKLRIGIIGTGGIAEYGHGPALAKTSNAELWSVLSRRRERAAEFSKQFSAQSSQPDYDSLEAFLSDPALDAVIVATPDKLHREHALAVARAGKHLLLEKPIATDYESAREIVQAFEAAKLRLGLCYRLRWHRGHREMVARAHAGEFGDLRHVRVLWSWHAGDASNWRASEELGRWWSLAGVGTHCLDLVRWTLLPGCGEVEKLESIVSRSVFRGPHDETAVLALRFESGATAEICSSVLFDSPSRFEIYGSKGFAIADSSFGRMGAGELRTNAGPMSYQNQDPFVGLIEDFADAVQSGRDPEVAGLEAARNVELLLSIPF